MNRSFHTVTKVKFKIDMFKEITGEIDNQMEDCKGRILGEQILMLEVDN